MKIVDTANAIAKTSLPRRGDFKNMIGDGSRWAGLGNWPFLEGTTAQFSGWKIWSTPVQITAICMSSETRKLTSENKPPEALAVLQCVRNRHRHPVGVTALLSVYEHLLLML